MHQTEPKFDHPNIPYSESRRGFGNCWLWGCGGCFVSVIAIVCIGWAIIFGISYYFVSDQEALYDQNNGYGSEEKPVPADTVLIFDDYQLQLSRLNVAADRQVLQMSEENKALPDGQGYALMWVSLTCTKSGSDTCSTSQPQISLIDEGGQDYNPPTLIYLETPFGQQTVQSGEMAEGWIAFVYADDWRNVDMVRVNDGIFHLYAQRPYD